MTLPRTRGHEEIRARLSRAAAAGRLPQSILLSGPAGVGKERLGLWIAQLAVCAAPDPEEGPCGRCQPCQLTLRLEHPDVHWFFPLPRPDASSPEKLREKLEELRAAELQQRRERPGHVPSFERAPAHFLASILTLQQIAAVRPAMGSRKVFVVGDAELMVPQESSPEAANAFLKLLEEPPADTVLVLTSSQPGALLPTIRSRVLPIRVPPVSEEAIRDYLVEELGTDLAEAERISRAAHGSLGRAIRLLPGADGGGDLARLRERGRALLLACFSSSAAPRFAAALAQKPTGGRGEFTGELEALAEWLRELLAVASGADVDLGDPEAGPILRRAVEQYGIHPLGVSDALDRVSDSIALAQGNVNPQLILATLLQAVHTALRPAGAPGERRTAHR